MGPESSVPSNGTFRYKCSRTPRLQSLVARLRSPRPPATSVSLAALHPALTIQMASQWCEAECIACGSVCRNPCTLCTTGADRLNQVCETDSSAYCEACSFSVNKASSSSVLLEDLPAPVWVNESNRILAWAKQIEAGEAQGVPAYCDLTITSSTPRTRPALFAARPSFSRPALLRRATPSTASLHVTRAQPSASVSAPATPASVRVPSPTSPTAASSLVAASYVRPSVLHRMKSVLSLAEPERPTAAPRRGTMSSARTLIGFDAVAEKLMDDAAEDDDDARSSACSSNLSAAQMAHERLNHLIALKSAQHRASRVHLPVAQLPSPHASRVHGRVTRTTA
jgi:hypothetical protein